MAILPQDQNRFIQTMPEASFIPGWDVPWEANSKNSVPRYAIDYSESGLTQPIGFSVEELSYLSKFKNLKLNPELKRISFQVKQGTVFKKSFTTNLFSTDPDINDFRDFILSKKSNLKNLKEYVFEEGGWVDPVRVIADVTGNKKEDVKAAIDWTKFLIIGGGIALIYSKLKGSSRK
ncbi:hypothetical protein LPTSP4_09100 [Leptospira ryugenii]|uniref:Uncharacterized protein n=1 Tax=Leptospira ryugenii TaxID=1917863 RepID=A0A2P2DXP2_9LEPT|nr:hypothetical protein [Leptospira ryugenii]GBF49397.1 hypothetical protein LPTSP4_09100 [Leptospira ryugenii]